MRSRQRRPSQQPAAKRALDVKGRVVTCYAQSSVSSSRRRHGETAPSAASALKVPLEHARPVASRSSDGVIRRLRDGIIPDAAVEVESPQHLRTIPPLRSVSSSSCRQCRRTVTLLARVGVLAAALLLAAPAAAAANTGDGFRIETTTVRPSADAFVNPRHPNRNSGGSRKLSADGRPHIHSYLRFRPRIGNATLKSARLGLYVRRGGSHRFAIARSSNHWRESQITWRNRPSAHRPLRHGRARRGRWVWVDVSALVRSGQPTSLRLATAGRRRLLFASRETPFSPKLRLTYEA